MRFEYDDKYECDGYDFDIDSWMNEKRCEEQRSCHCMPCPDLPCPPAPAMRGFDLLLLNEKAQPLRCGVFTLYNLYCKDNDCVALPANMAENNDVYRSAVSGCNGVADFGRIAAGNYALRQTAAPYGYAADDVYHLVQATAKSIMVDGKRLPFTVYNHPLVSGD